MLGDLWKEAWRSHVPNTCHYSSLRGCITSQGKNVCALMVIYPWYPEQVLFVTRMEILSLKEKNNKEDLTIHSPKFRTDFLRRLSGALEPWWPSLNLPSPSQVPSGLPRISKTVKYQTTQLSKLSHPLVVILLLSEWVNHMNVRVSSPKPLPEERASQKSQRTFLRPQKGNPAYTVNLPTPKMVVEPKKKKKKN